jgi:Flp pilus assembly CpaF family ATPase
LASDLIQMGAVTQGTIDFLRACVKARKNIIVSGGTGTGKTTFLNLLSSFLPDDERIVTIEDAAELRLCQQHVIRLEARPPNIEGKGAIAIRDLVRNALRMRPDRIVVGEVRGGEALDMLQAMNTGHEGSLTTVHANSPRDVISRLETMVLMAGMDLPVRAIREQIGHRRLHAGGGNGGRRRAKLRAATLAIYKSCPTGFSPLDDVLTGGLRPGELCHSWRPVRGRERPCLRSSWRATSP